MESQPCLSVGIMAVPWDRVRTTSAVTVFMQLPLPLSLVSPVELCFHIFYPHHAVIHDTDTESRMLASTGGIWAQSPRCPLLKAAFLFLPATYTTLNWQVLNGMSRSRPSGLSVGPVGCDCQEQVYCQEFYMHCTECCPSTEVWSMSAKQERQKTSQVFNFKM